jgi:hypothetical protein
VTRRKTAYVVVIIGDDGTISTLGPYVDAAKAQAHADAWGAAGLSALVTPVERPGGPGED